LIKAAHVNIYYFRNAFNEGASETDAALAAAEQFMASFADGLSIPAKSSCTAAAKAYVNALNEKPSTPVAAAMTAFMEAAIAQGNSKFVDPVCAASALAYLQAFKAGDSEQTAAFKAAQAFIDGYKKGKKMPPNSPCASAARAYASKIEKKPNPPHAAAMMAFMDEALLTNARKVDPVCLAAAEAYFDAHIRGSNEAQATEIAGAAFLNAVEADPDYSPLSPCGKAAKAYMATFDIPL
jgi:hypothetical protein